MDARVTMNTSLYLANIRCCNVRLNQQAKTSYMLFYSIWFQFPPPPPLTKQDPVLTRVFYKIQIKTHVEIVPLDNHIMRLHDLPTRDDLGIDWLIGHNLIFLINSHTYICLLAQKREEPDQCREDSKPNESYHVNATDKGTVPRIHVSTGGGNVGMTWIDVKHLWLRSHHSDNCLKMSIWNCRCCC